MEMKTGVPAGPLECTLHWGPASRYQGLQTTGILLCSTAAPDTSWILKEYSLNR